MLTPDDKQQLAAIFRRAWSSEIRGIKPKVDLTWREATKLMEIAHSEIDDAIRDIWTLQLKRFH
jgi:hypothetical protein